MNTSLFNHKAIGTVEKPLIPNVVFKALLILADHKDPEACEYIIKCYTLHPHQKQMYEQINNTTGDSGTCGKRNP